MLRHLLLGGLVTLHVAGFVAYHAGDTPAVEHFAALAAQEFAKAYSLDPTFRPTWGVAKK